MYLGIKARYICLGPVNTSNFKDCQSVFMTSYKLALYIATGQMCDVLVEGLYNVELLDWDEHDKVSVFIG